MTPKPCCSPRREVDGTVVAPRLSSCANEQASFATVLIPGGHGFLGTNSPKIPDDGEGPFRKKALQPFEIGTTTVTNAEFAEFVATTNYETDAERFGWSFVFWSDVSRGLIATAGVAGAEWWRRVDGANWRDIHGPGTASVVWHADHPVVHVSWNDAVAYAAWAGGRLPTEAEWEHAARGGQQDVPYPWGYAEPDDFDYTPCNIWQGQFPKYNSAKDGWVGSAPARSFAANGYGLFNMVGNVWEWTANNYTVRSLKKRVRQRLTLMRGFRVLKGGSFLCHRSYCDRYRIAARTGNSPDSTTAHQGFRVVWDQIH